MTKKKAQPKPAAKASADAPVIKPVDIVFLVDVPRLGRRGEVDSIDPQQLEVRGLYEDEDYRLATDTDIARARS